MPKGCELEGKRQTENSPGVVQNDENLVRYVISPFHWDEIKNEVKPAIFSSKELNESGASTQRLLYSTLDFLLKRGNEQAARGQDKNRKFLGVIKAQCGRIRDIKESKEQAISILDTALPDNIGHADIFLSRSYQKSVQLKLRKELINKFSSLLEIDHNLFE